MLYITKKLSTGEYAVVKRGSGLMEKTAFKYIFFPLAG